MELTDVVRGLLGEIRQLTESESVVGKPIQVGESLIIPVTKMSVGFGTAQGEGSGGKEPGKGSMGGLGGGIALDPQGFLVVDKGGSAQLLALSDAKQGALAKAIEAVPQVVDKIVSRNDTKAIDANGGGEALPSGDDN